jgi:type VI secretion system ImpB/VipA family protein
VRSPRVHITSDVEIGDAIDMKELSCVMGVLADLSGRPDEPLPELRDRGFIEIDRDFLHEVLNRTKLHLAYQVANKLTDEDAHIGVDLRFGSMEDFDPAQVVQQVEPLRRLLEIRTLLSALLVTVGGHDRFNELLQNIIRSPELLQRVSQEIGIEAPGDTEKGSEEEQPNDRRMASAQTDASEGLQQEESLLDRIISESRVSRDDEERAQSRRQIGTLAEGVMQGTVRVAENLEETIHGRIAAINRLRSRQLNEIMYAPEFQQLEATWRGLHYLAHQTETSTMLKLRVLNVSKNDRKRSPT